MKLLAYEEEITSAQVAVVRERFTPDFEVLSVSFALPEEADDLQTLPFSERSALK